MPIGNHIYQFLLQLQISSEDSTTSREIHNIAMATTTTNKGSSTPSGPTIVETLRESLRLPSQNVKAAVTILLLLLIPSSLLFLGNQFVLKPLIMDLLVKSVLLHRRTQGSPEYMKLLQDIKEDVGIILGEEALFLLATKIVSLVAAVATIYASAAAFTGKEMSPKYLFLRIARGWKQPVITWLYIKFFDLGFLVYFALLVGFLVVLAKGSFVLAAVGVFVLVLSFILYLYLGVVWTLGLVISVVEEGCYGLAAIGRAGELIKGRKRQGLALSLLFTAIAVAVSWVLFFQMKNISYSEAVRLVIGAVAVNLSCLIALYHSVAFTVFYYGCKLSHGEEVQGKEFLGYSLVPTTAHVDSAIP